MSTTTHPRPPGLRDDASSLEDLSSPAVEVPAPPAPPALSAREAMRVLPRVVEEAREASGAAREEEARRVNDHLVALAAGGASREVADVLLQLLEQGQLSGLEEREGRTCRSVAVETLVQLGFPYALEVRPEDLEHLLKSRVPRHRPGLPEAAASVALGAGLVGQWLVLPETVRSGTDGMVLPLVLYMGLSLLGLMTGVLGPERSNSRRAGLLVLALLSLLQIFLNVFEGYHGAVSGVAGLVACLLFLLPRR